MASISLETINAEVSVFPFTGLTAIQRQQSGIARAQVSLVFPQTTLSSTSAGNIKALRMEGELPRNFAYVYVGGSMKLGRVDTTDVLDQSRGVYFENEIQCGITGDQFQDSWKMLNEGSTKMEPDVVRDSDNLASAYNYRVPNNIQGSSVTHFATPGVLNGAQGLYQKIYKDSVYPRIIYRAGNGEIEVTADAINTIEDPFPASQYIAVGEMHFLQYDIDQAYNYLIHSPIPVR